MEKPKFDRDKIIKYWIDSSDDDYETMSTMYESKRYSWSLFVGHLMIEKLLKAYYIQKMDDFPPFIHNLLRLADECNLKLTNEQRANLASITAFNINTRYDDYRMSFKEKCTPEFTNEWIKKIKLMRQWIKELIK